MKKIISVVMSVLMLVTIPPLEVFAEEELKNESRFSQANIFSYVSDEESFELNEEHEEAVIVERNNLLSASSKEASVSVIPSNDDRLSGKYLLMYSIDNSYLTAENNGGALGSNAFSNAFDRNWNSLWRSQSEQVDGFTNTIDVTFKGKVSIDRLLYSADSYYGRGYPITLKLKFVNETEDYEEELIIKSSATSDTVIFDFGKTYECNKIQLEWVECPKNHRYEASAREIVFLQPETEETVATDSLFSDYNQFTLNEKYNSMEAIEALDESLKGNVNYKLYYKSIIERAKKIVSGELKYSAKNEFSTVPSNSEITKINQYGGLRSYAQNTLRLNWFGIDRQTTGFYGRTGDVLRIYVDADEDEICLPTLNITQHYGTANTWKRDYKLKKGLNLITVPDFGAGTHDNPAVAGGGPIYISNPYTSQEQGEVKVYIEGAYSFPVYRMLPEESSHEEKLVAAEKFLKELEEYCKDGFVPGEYPLDLIELQSDHCLMTVKASLAEASYITNANSNSLKVQENLENYDAYMERLMKFEGITFDKSDKYYDVKNEYLSINFRACQSTGVLAYATSERVGLLNDSWQNTVLYSTGIGRGWGLTHEIGHTLDMYSDRAKFELTNNMLSKYNETALGGGDGTRGDFNADVANLSSDRKDYTQSSYLESNMYNYCIWWHLESYTPGYWAKLSNMYRYYEKECSEEELELIKQLKDRDEKQVYYSSLILGVDLGYYYERYGFKVLGSNQFIRQSASDAYKTLMENAATQGRINNTIQPRFWYLDEKQYNLVVESENGVEGLGKAFGENEQTYIRGIEKLSTGYSVVMPPIEDSNTLLGYEIYEGQDIDSAEVIGFSKNGVFLDTTEYADGYVPKYWVKAFNRDLTSSAISEPAIPSNGAVVCQNGDVEYKSISQAVAEAQSGDTITLVSDLTETGVVIDKDITIEIKEGLSLTHYRGSVGSLFTVNENCTLTINGDGRLTLDGNYISQNMPVINVGKSATLNLNSVTIQNAVSTSNGGGVLANSSKINITGCTFKNNIALNGGAVAATVPAGRITIDNTVFNKNKGTQNGGAVYSVATLDLTNSTFENNEAENGGAICNTNGGIIRIKVKNIFKSNKAENGGALWLNGLSTVENAELTSNEATKNGGGVYYTTEGATRPVSISNSTFAKNSSSLNGSDIYALINHNNPKLTLNSNVVENSPCLKSRVYVEKGNLTVNSSDFSAIGVADAESATVVKNSSNIVVTLDNGVVITMLHSDLSTDLVLPNLQIGKSKRILGTVLNDTINESIVPDRVVGFDHTPSGWITDTDSTCKNEGTKHKECAVCGDTLETGKIDKVPHTPSGWITDTDSTCKNEGTKHKECTVCGDTLETEKIPMTKHNTVPLKGYAPTCTAAGLTEGEICSNCYTVTKAQNTIPATGHKDENSDGKCDNCSEELSKPSCSCDCHSTNGFKKFIWKILCFFYKIFGTNKVCGCGSVHY